MAASVVYSTFGGRVVAESRGGVIRQYVPDNLGSTVALIDDAGNVTDTYDYWPYGEERVHVGTSTTPLTFLGTLGYFKDFLNMLYVRARHLRVDLTQWMTVDPLWPGQRAYGYVSSSPTEAADPSGTLAGPSCPPGHPSCTAAWRNCVMAYCLWCTSQKGVMRQLCTMLCDLYASGYSDACGKSRYPRRPEHWIPVHSSGPNSPIWIVPDGPITVPTLGSTNFGGSIGGCDNPDCSQESHVCAAAMISNTGLGVFPLPNIQACYGCCAKAGACANACAAGCPAALKLAMMYYAAQFGGPSGAGEGFEAL
ncbi:MAG: RHS repeat domain-containing protein [Fimbriimonadaceae bacterium]